MAPRHRCSCLHQWDPSGLRPRSCGVGREPGAEGATPLGTSPPAHTWGGSGRVRSKTRARGGSGPLAARGFGSGAGGRPLVIRAQSCLMLPSPILLSFPRDQPCCARHCLGRPAGSRIGPFRAVGLERGPVLGGITLSGCFAGSPGSWSPVITGESNPYPAFVPAEEKAPRPGGRELTLAAL